MQAAVFDRLLLTAKGEKEIHLDHFAFFHDKPRMIQQGVFFCFTIFAVGLSGCAASGQYSLLLPLEQTLIYRPSPPLESDPRCEAENIFFTTADGVRLHGLFFAHPHPCAVVLFCHGNAGSVESWSPAAIELQQRHQCAVFLFDYRGFGQSEGTPTEEGILLDARAARDWLMRRSGTLPADVVLVGRSLGGAVAVDLAAQGGARGLVLESTFSSLPDVAAYHLPWALPHLMMTQRYNSVEKIKHYRGPLLQSHGDADRLIPLSLAKKLFDAAPGSKRFITIPGADHNDPPNDAFAQALDEFLAGLSPPQADH